ncbi:helicase-like protein [Beggiatoa sp. PS]|nr:helicase-like protein [Beggiatoa sp. PS]
MPLQTNWRMELGLEEFALDNRTVLQSKRKLAAEFRQQLAHSLPSNAEEAALQQLAQQLRDQKIHIQLFLRYPLHAKLYLIFRDDPVSPVTGYLGSSNLTISGLSNQGELNVDVVDQDAATKLADWFEQRWQDRFCVDISKQLIEVIEQSWASDETVPPYYIYLKIAYHLSQEARAGLNEFSVPPEFGNKLFDYQSAAVRLAARHLNQRGGVLIGDVVGLGKTLMATALAKIFENVYRLETLILCPKNLVAMWQNYCDRYLKMVKVLSVTQVKKLATLKRYHIVILDESHNLRNREGQRYKAIQTYIDKNDCKVILLSATPYNKTYLDLANQLRLFLPEHQHLGVSPEKYLAKIGIPEFNSRYQCDVHTLAAFEKSEYAEDWRKLMRLYMVRRTRSFIQANYAPLDEDGHQHLVLENGQRVYFPNRLPKTVKFTRVDGQYATLYGEATVNTITTLNLPRYGLGQYIEPKTQVSKQAEQIIKDLARGGRRLIGFCRTNLFKRLESSGEAFILSLQRHILRNAIFLYALEHQKAIPIGSQNGDILDFDTRLNDDEEAADESTSQSDTVTHLKNLSDFQQRAAEIYQRYQLQYAKKFKWLAANCFSSTLSEHLQQDINALLTILNQAGDWRTSQDTKLNALAELLTQQHPNDKVLIFTQFADTAHYLKKQLLARGLTDLEAVTGQSSQQPTEMAWRFSPVSNEQWDTVKPTDEIRVLIATDVLSEGQNLQDAGIVVNYDLPWAIIRLIQRVGRVDRIGQQHPNILCYSFLPADGIEQIIHLRARLKTRLRQNAEVVGTDETFFEDEDNQQILYDLYHEKAGVLEGEVEQEVDLVSEAYAIWKQAIQRDPHLKKIIPKLPAVAYSTKPHFTAEQPEGVLMYMDTPEGHDAIIWLDHQGQLVSESPEDILKAAACSPETMALPRHDNHHRLVQQGVKFLLGSDRLLTGGLGKKNGARYRTYMRLKAYLEKQGTLLEPDLQKAIDAIYKYPLQLTAVDILNLQWHAGILDSGLAATVVTLYQDERLCIIHEHERKQEPQIICSLGLKRP